MIVSPPLGWGNNAFGQLGIGITTTKLSPVNVEGRHPIIVCIDAPERPRG
jgi:hypothetical protein